MWRVYMRQNETIGPWFQRIERQPGWVTKAALITAALVLGLPLLLLTLAAVVVGLTVFTVLGLVAAGVATLGRLFAGGLTMPWPERPDQPGRPGAGGDDGRRNVRVIRRE